MKRFFLALFVSFWTLLPAAGLTQTTTPNRGLGIPQAVPGSWGETYNNNFIELDLSKINRFTNATKPTAPEVNEVIVITDSATGTTCTTGGGSTVNICQWTGSAWVVLGGGGGGSGVGHAIEDESVPVPQEPIINFTGAGVAVTPGVGKTIVTIPGVTAAPTTVQTNQSNTYTTGDQNMAAAASLTVPTATGAAPTGSGRIAFDSTAAIPSQAYKAGLAGVTRSFGLVDGNLGTFSGTFTGTATNLQPLNANLTQISGVTTGANRMLIHNGTSWMTSVMENCNGANDVVKYDNILLDWGCGTFAGGISGLAAGVYPEAASATTLTNGVISRSGAVVTINATTVQQGPDCTVNCLTENLTISGLHTRTRFPGTGDEIVSEGAKGVGQMAVFNAAGKLVQGGAPAAAPPPDSVTVAMVQSPLKIRSLFIPIGDRVLGSALTDAQDYPIVWRNNVAAMTVTEVWCQTDAGTATIMLQRDIGSLANILSSNLPCTTTGATGTISGAASTLSTGDRIAFVMVTAGGVAKEVNISIQLVLN